MADLPQDNLPENDFGDRMADLLTSLVRGLVDHPDAVHVEIDEEEEDTTALSVFVAPDDLDLVNGKQGRTARSLRTVLSAMAGKAQQRISLEVLADEDDGTDEEDGKA